jgi:alpha,alpha-trehalose phosphorylase
VVVQLRQEQRAWLDGFWDTSDVEIDGDDSVQQAVRWSLFQLAQASACTNELGIAAKGLTGGGYDGHYFWDTEVYVLPFLAYTNANAARKVLRYRWHMLDQARQRADELSQQGALYPWRTISGEEASAYYAAGTAQYHINAAIAYAIERYASATGDIDFLAGEGAEILVETARLWEDLGFYAVNGADTFHIHGVTGPDEYTTVVNDNLYTNVMARFNMEYAASTAELLASSDPETYASLCRRTGLDAAEIEGWKRAAATMYLPFDDDLGIHPQDENFLARERWDLKATPADKYPLLLHFHPLVIYRHQVLKQADVVLAMYLLPDHFDIEQKRRNFDYYDPLTTGDSSLSACVQSIVAADVGRDELALAYFLQAVYLDLQDMHGNTADGAHIANAGGVWATLMHGFAGMADAGPALRFTPRLPAGWNGMKLRCVRHGVKAEVEVDQKQCVIRVLEGGTVPVETPEGTVEVGTDEELVIPKLL